MQAVTGEDNADGRITDRLAAHAAAKGDLDAWLSRFASLRHTIPASGTLAEVAEGATAVAEGILRAKLAAAAAKVRDASARRHHCNAWLFCLVAVLAAQVLRLKHAATPKASSSHQR